jgi:hypothetical protein
MFRYAPDSGAKGNIARLPRWARTGDRSALRASDSVNFVPELPVEEGCQITKWFWQSSQSDKGVSSWASDPNNVVHDGLVNDGTDRIRKGDASDPAIVSPQQWEDLGVEETTDTRSAFMV